MSGFQRAMCSVRRSAMMVSCISGVVLLPYAAMAQDKPTDGAGNAVEKSDAAGEKEPVKREKADSGDIVVTGQRLGFSTASEIKRDAPQSVSVLTTTDLRNIPDTILIDIVRRIPGVQVSQGGGGGIVSIRGLPQLEVRLNGRNFPSTISRSFDVSSLPGDIVSGVAVYKTPTVDQIEGGVAGIIDFRTRRPLDFKGFAAAGTVKGVYANVDDKVDPVMSGYVSNRWKAGDGDIGLLVGGSFQRQRNALDLLLGGGNRPQTNAGGTNVDAPTNFDKTYNFYTREVSSVYGSAQARFGDVESVVDVVYGQSSAFGGGRTLSANYAGGTPTGPFSLYPDSSIFRSGSYARVPLSSNTTGYTLKLQNFQIGWNNVYKPDDRTTLSFDVAYNTSDYNADARVVSLTGSAPTATLDLDRRYPFSTIGGVDQTSPAAFAYSYLLQQIVKAKSDNFQARLEGTYEFDSPLRAIQFGLRYDTRSIDSGNGVGFVGAPAGIAPVSQSPFLGLTPDRLYKDNGVQQRQWTGIRSEALRDRFGELKQLFGFPDTAFNPATVFNGTEKTYAAYGLAKLGFTVGGMPVDGNAGVRIVRTDLTLDGTRTGAVAGTRTPITSTASYVDVLPAINLRLTLTDGLYLRMAYSKQVSRPSFGSLSPIVTLNPANTAGQRTASGGNPDLKPLRTDQFDVSLEHYFGRDNSIYAAGFYKDIDGFVANAVTTETFDGLIYQITRPQNLNKGYVAGGEVGYRQTFSFLPGALSGLGINASYTYVNGTKRPNRVGIIIPYEQITKHNYQLSGFYNKYGISANVNWVWRSRLLEVSAADTQGRPDYRIPFGQLDANLLYQLSPRVTLQISGQNLTQSLIRRSFGDPRLFAQNALENRRILAGFQFKLGDGI